MANKDDFLTEYRQFFENFAQNVNPNEQLPVKIANYKLISGEVIGGVIDWTTEYLNQKECPTSLLAPLIRIIIQEVRKTCKKNPIACGYNNSDNAYEPVKLMQSVIATTNEICKRYLDNSQLSTLPFPNPLYTPAGSYAIKNTRRVMEDRHVIIYDLNTLFDIKDASPSSYFAVFDGHAGRDAAAYSSAHLHQFLIESNDFISKPAIALRDAFLKTDAAYLEKCAVEDLNSGTTALCALIRHKDKTLYLGWVGDSQAIIAKHGKVISCVQPHKPDREDERLRIEKEGGSVLIWCGVSRVDGQIAISRAIGDINFKPYVTAVPDIIEFPLCGDEDFLILACDGLWDGVSEQEAASIVYDALAKNCEDTNVISKKLVEKAKQQGSTDNITVITVFLREPQKVAVEAHWAVQHLTMDTLDNANATNPFVSNDLLVQKDGFVLNLADGDFQKNGSTTSPDYVDLGRNGNVSVDDFDSDDLGPETDVDAVDDVLLSPMKNVTINNSDKEKATFETESDLNPMDVKDKPVEKQEVTSLVDSVHTGGLVENVADSGEDSDDEWNYFKGDSAKSEQKVENQEVCEEDELNVDTMSQLNPNAAEFVPVSPKRNESSPVGLTLLEESVIAQSPRRPLTTNEMDINLPNLQDFESEVKSRPSDVDGSNGHEDIENITSQERMQNLLNGKTIDEIEFQPLATPRGEEFHFGPTASPFSTPSTINQSEVSTRAVFGDESNYLDGKDVDLFLSGVLQSKETEDPMSTSFYQDKDKNDPNPFDLNTVQQLPENLEEFLEKPIETSAQLPQPQVTPDLLNDNLITVSEVTETVECTMDGFNALAVTHTVETTPHEDTKVPLDQCDLISHTQQHEAIRENLLFNEQFEQKETLTEINDSFQSERDSVFPVQHSPPFVAPQSPTLISPLPVQSEQTDVDFLQTTDNTRPNVKSPLDDLTLSIKDSPSSPASPMSDHSPISDVAQSNFLDETALVVDTLGDKSVEFIDTESVVTAEVHSLLERSPVPDLTSPLSPGDVKEETNATLTPQLVFESMEETIKVTSSQIVPAPAPIVVAKSTPTTEKSKKPEPIKKPTTTTRTSGTSSRPAATRTTTSTTTTSKTTLSKTTTKAPKPKSPVATTKLIEKKPLSNGDVKPLPRTNLVRKAPLPAAATKPTSAKVGSASKVEKAPARPLSAPAKPPIERKRLVGTTSAPKPRPTTLTSQTTATKTTSSTLTKSTKTMTATTTTTTTAAASRPRTSTTSAKPSTVTLAKPRVPAARPLPKAPDAAKQLKETANKQTARVNLAPKLSSTRSVASKVDTKGPAKTSTRTTTTTATTLKSITKKPSELVRNVSSKTKTTVIKKQANQNGITSEVTTTVINQNNIEPQLVKDTSPLEKPIDNNVTD